MLADDLNLLEEFNDFNININGNNLNNDEYNDEYNDESNENNNEIVFITLTAPDNTPKNKREKQIMNLKIYELLNIRKNKKLSYLDLRKLLIIYSPFNHSTSVYTLLFAMWRKKWNNTYEQLEA